MREELRNKVDSMLKMGVVRPYTSPIIMVKKKDGSNGQEILNCPTLSLICLSESEEGRFILSVTIVLTPHTRERYMLRNLKIQVVHKTVIYHLLLPGVIYLLSHEDVSAV